MYCRWAFPGFCNEPLRLLANRYPAIPISGFRENQVSFNKVSEASITMVFRL